MKRHVAFVAGLLLASLPGYAAHSYANFSKPNPRTDHVVSKNAIPLAVNKLRPVDQRGSTRTATRRQTRPRALSNPAPSSVGYVSAVQVATGGETYYNAVTADFNGDGKKDVATIVQNGPCCSPTLFLSVELGNGNGTFQAPKLTAGLNSNQSNGGQLFVGDLNGDGKQDLVVGYQAASYISVPSSLDVFMGNGDGTFTFSANYPITLNSIAGAAMADVNGDGKLDMLVVDQGPYNTSGPSSAWVVPGVGDGTFGTPASVALSGMMYNAVMGDLNGDGKLDIAGNDPNNNYMMTVYLASGSGYATGAAYSTSDSVSDACFLTSGDLTGDGKAELVAANCGDNNVTVWVNNGDGTFQTGAYYASGAYPEAVTIADINGDGRADLVTSNDDSSDVTVLSGNGDGTVNPAIVGYATGGYPYVPVLVADFNGDGAADIIIPDDAFSLAFLPGYGDGSFRAAVNYYTQGTLGYEYGLQIASGDFNGDGNPDFVISNGYQSGYGVTVFLSRGDGSMQPGVSYNGLTGQPLYYVAVADFNGDGKLDIAATSSNDGTVQLFSGVGDGTFLVGNAYPTDTTSSYPFGIAVGDFNADGSTDLAIVNYQTQDLAVLLNDKTGNFPTLTTYPLSAQAYEVTAADLNGDGFPELVVPLYYGSSSGIATFAGSSNGSFGSEVDVSLSNSLTTFLNPYAAVVGDLNGDGKADIAVTIEDYTNYAQGVAVVPGNGDGTFQTPTLFATTLQPFAAMTNYYYPYPSYLKLNDLNGDGKIDVVYTNSNYSTVGILFNQGGGAFYDPAEFPAGGYAYGLSLADVNGDGAVDAVTAGDDFSGVTVLLNNSGSGAMANYTLSANPTTATMAAGSAGTFNLSVTPINGYNGTITFSCGTLPAGASCSFNPPSVTPAANQTVQVVLTVQTSAAKAFAASAQPRVKSSSPSLWASLSGMGIFGLLFAGDFKKRNLRSRVIVLGVLLLVMMLSLVGCGGSSTTPPAGNTGTPSGTYSLQVNATGTGGSFNGNTSAHSLSLSITVQ